MTILRKSHAYTRLVYRPSLLPQGHAGKVTKLHHSVVKVYTPPPTPSLRNPMNVYSADTIASMCPVSVCTTTFAIDLCRQRRYVRSFLPICSLSKASSLDKQHHCLPSSPYCNTDNGTSVTTVYMNVTLRSVYTQKSGKQPSAGVGLLRQPIAIVHHNRSARGGGAVPNMKFAQLLWSCIVNCVTYPAPNQPLSPKYNHHFTSLTSTCGIFTQQKKLFITSITKK